MMLDIAYSPYAHQELPAMHTPSGNSSHHLKINVCEFGNDLPVRAHSTISQWRRAVELGKGGRTPSKC